MAMFGQQLGRLEIDGPVETPFASAMDVGHLRPMADSTGFSGGQAWVTGPPRIDTGAFDRRRDAWGLHQHVEAYVAPPAEPGTSLQAKADLASGRPAAAIELMLRRLLADHRVLAARKLADAVPLNQALDESLRRLLVVLAEPVVRRRLPAGPKDADNIEWLRRNAGSHAGRWVALADGRLLAADESLAALRRKVQQFAPHVEPLLHRL